VTGRQGALSSAQHEMTFTPPGSTTYERTSDGDVLKLFKKALSLNGSLLSLIIEEEKQDVSRKFGLHSPTYCETRTGSRRVRVCKRRVTKESLYE
jgi:hypothetical protein